jgi:Zn-dependent peptidase ImmA (M78 family)/transcriptional regulator with XRE-family HTH domain
MVKIIRVPINPEILKWALEDLNLSIEEFAHKVGKKPEKINKWLEGKSYPTYNQLEKISYKILKIPLAAFFLPEPPKNLSIKKKFRTLPDYVFALTSYGTRLAIRKADFFRTSLYELYKRNPSIDPIHKGIKLSAGSDPFEAAVQIRETFKINIVVQKSFKNYYHAFNYYRDKLEENGIFLFQLQLEGDRGFCILDEEFPLIVVNSSDSITSKIFTLFHELVHILTGSDDIYKEIEPPSYKQEYDEIFCNRTASEIIVPMNEFKERYSRNLQTWNEQLISKAADEYKVSREVILIKLLNLGYAKQSDYSTLKNKWDEEFRRRKNAGGNYYVIKMSALGKQYIYTVIDYYKKGILNDLQVSNYLDMKFSNISGIEAEVFT